MKYEKYFFGRVDSCRAKDKFKCDISLSSYYLFRFSSRFAIIKIIFLLPSVVCQENNVKPLAITFASVCINNMELKASHKTVNPGPRFRLYTYRLNKKKYSIYDNWQRQFSQSTTPTPAKILGKKIRRLEPVCKFSKYAPVMFDQI